MLYKTIKVAVSLLFATTAIAFPIPFPLSTGSCSNEGTVTCLSDSTYQVCASGQWTVTLSVAAGTTCSGVFGTTSSSSTPVPAPAPAPAPAAPAPAAPAPAAPAPAPVTTTPATTNPSNEASTPVSASSAGVPQSYSGPASNFPASSAWESFDNLWQLNMAALQYNDDAADIASMLTAIQTVAGMTNGLIDERVILAIIMQESSGNVHVISTNNGVQNNGIMQSHDGVSYSSADPAGSIMQMVKDGVLGVSGPTGGPGVLGLVQQYGNLWEGIRAYNSGSVDASNLSDGLGSTPSYCTDIANRLLGAKSG
ncbi:hypothetical protein MMC13_007229 [Lambiella insularis]|nr:hypothetical protein [Lambiella insularis]